MTRHDDWAAVAPQVIYEAYLDHDVLLIDPPKPGETIGEFKVRAEDSGDTLFLFLCREAAEDIDVHVYLARLERAIHDIEAVRVAFRQDLHTRACDDEQPSESGPGKIRADVTIRLALDNDWIELALTYPDDHGRRQGGISSSLHTVDGDDAFNAAMDAIESLVLGHVCAGIDVTDPRYVEGIRTCIEACGNNLEGGGDS